LLRLVNSQIPLIATAGVLSLAAFVVIVIACRAASRSLALSAQGLGIIAGVLALVPFFLVLLPSATSLSPRLIEHVRSLDPGHSRPLACSGYQEDSLVFATRGRIQRVPEDSIAVWAAAHPEGLVIAPIDSSPAAESLRGAGWHDDFHTRGVNLGRGKLVDVGVWTRGAK